MWILLSQIWVEQILPKGWAWSPNQANQRSHPPGIAIYVGVSTWPSRVLSGSFAGGYVIRYYNLYEILSSEDQGNLGLSSVIMEGRRERKREKIWEEKGENLKTW